MYIDTTGAGSVAVNDWGVCSADCFVTSAPTPKLPPSKGPTKQPAPKSAPTKKPVKAPTARATGSPTHAAVYQASFGYLPSPELCTSPCVKFKKTKPFIAKAPYTTPPSSSGVTTTSWCYTGPGAYSLTDPTKNELWGFCSLYVATDSPETPPTDVPTSVPSGQPTTNPVTSMPTAQPTSPTNQPTVTAQPVLAPTVVPTAFPVKLQSNFTGSPVTGSPTKGDAPGVNSNLCLTSLMVVAAAVHFF